MACGLLLKKVSGHQQKEVRKGQNTHNFSWRRHMTEYQRILLTTMSYFFILCFLIYVVLFYILPKPAEVLTTIPAQQEIKLTTFGTKKDWQYLRKKVLKIQGRHCLKCGKKQDRMHIDHIRPKSKYPHLEFKIDNLQVLCGDCNRKKSFDKEVDYRSTHHLMALLKEVKTNKLIKRKYTHNLKHLEKLTIAKFQKDLRKG